MTSILLRNGKIIDVVKQSIWNKDVLIENNQITKIENKIHDFPEKTQIFDVKGQYISPGLIDAHMHIESTMMPPLEFCYHAVKHGTTTILVDPHEIANVAGMAGMKLWLEQAELVPLDMYVAAPSCVPATHMEHSGATLNLENIQQLMKNEMIYGLGEMMNFPGIIFDIGDARNKVQAALDVGKLVDGHAPGVTGEDLDKYITNGKQDGNVRIMTDHESTTASEVKEKIEKGMYIALRYASASRDLNVILPELIKENYPLDKIMLCSDDIAPSELYDDGHVDRIVQQAREIILEGSDLDLKQATLIALKLASYNSGKYLEPYLKLTNKHPIGAIQPGYAANLVIFNNLEDLSIDSVINQGKFVVKQGKMQIEKEEYDYNPFLNSVHISKTFTADDFIIPYTKKDTSVNVKIIESSGDSLITKKVIMKWPIQTIDGVRQIKSDVAQDVLKIAVLERHHNTGNRALGLIRGLNIKKGAIASTVAHDNHNLIVVGTNDAEMAKLTNEMIARGGGMGALIDGNITFFPLQISGLMSTDPLQEIIQNYKNVKKIAQSMGSNLENVFMTLSFMALAVIPELRITDMGLVDVNKFEIVDLIEKP